MSYTSARRGKALAVGGPLDASHLGLVGIECDQLVADEVYPLLHFGTPTPPPLRRFDPGSTVVSLGSFSKIFGPGLRLGTPRGL